MGQQIRKEDFLDYTLFHEIAGDLGRGSHKILTAQVTITSGIILYVVEDHGKEIVCTASLDDAIRVYNEIG